MLRSLDTYDYEYRNFIDKDLQSCKFDFCQHNLNEVTYIRDKLSNINKEINDNNYNEVFFNFKYFIIINYRMLYLILMNIILKMKVA